MRGKKAKRLRREVYGDLSTSPKGRAYHIVGGGVRWFLTGRKRSDGTPERSSFPVHTFSADEARRKYQQAKKEAKR